MGARKRPLLNPCTQEKVGGVRDVALESTSGDQSSRRSCGVRVWHAGERTSGIHLHQLRIVALRAMPSFTRCFSQNSTALPAPAESLLAVERTPVSSGSDTHKGRVNERGPFPAFNRAHRPCVPKCPPGTGFTGHKAQP